jgi:transposase InsO family protein
VETRLRIVQAVRVHGLRISDVAMAHGLSRKTVWQFLRAYEAGGEAGLQEVLRRPQLCPQRKPPELEAAVLALRQEHGWGAGRIGAEVAAAGSTVHRILSQHGLSNLTPARPKYPRYEMSRPGELVHVDIKQLVPLRSGQDPQHLFAALDAYSREVSWSIMDKASGAASLEFLEYVLASSPYRIEAVLTDNGLAFSMRRSAHPERECPFQRTLRERHIEHRLTKPYTPRTNGKVERFFGTLGRELLRCVRFRDSQHRQEATAAFLDYYNNRRPHSAIGFNAPTPYRVHYFQSNT